MKFQSLVQIASFALGSSASIISPQNAVDEDCGSAVASISNAQADCSSNVVSSTIVTVIVTPEALTVTETTTFHETSTATTVQIDTELTTLTSDIFLTQTSQAYTTDYSISTQFLTVTVPVILTPSAVTATVTLTTTIQPTSTITTYVPTASAVKRRDLELTRSVNDEDEEVCEIYVEEVWVEDDGPTMSFMSSTESTLSVDTVSPTQSFISIINSTTSVESYTSVETTASFGLTSSVDSTTSVELTSLIESVPSIESASFTVSPTLTSAISSIPTYASACRSWTDYVTACSSLGISQVTSTVSFTVEVNTITVFISSTLTVFQTATSSTDVVLEVTTLNTIVASITQTSTLVLPSVVQSTSTAYITSTLDPTTVYITETLTVTGTSPSVATVSSTIRPFKLLMVPVAGGTSVYLTTGAGNGIVYTGASTMALAKTFVIDLLGRLVTTDIVPQIACQRNSISNYYMNSLTAAGIVTYASSFTPLKCIVASDLTLTCPVGTSASFTMYAANGDFFYSTAGFNGYPTYIAHLVYV